MRKLNTNCVVYVERKRESVAIIFGESYRLEQKKAFDKARVRDRVKAQL